jgi:hypothetical protein
LVVVVRHGVGTVPVSPPAEIAVVAEDAVAVRESFRDQFPVEVMGGHPGLAHLSLMNNFDPGAGVGVDFTYA